MNTARDNSHEDPLNEQVRKLEERIARIEARLALSPAIGEQAPEPEPVAPPPGTPVAAEEDELEFEVGQNWFAKAGIIVIAIGIVFLLTFPYRDMPAMAPGLFGYVLTTGLFLLAHLWRNTFDIVSRYLRGAGMALLFFTTLRLFYFGTDPALRIESAAGVSLFAVVVAVNVAIAFRRKSRLLFALALTTGFAAAIATGMTWFVMITGILLCVLVVYARVRYDWPGILVYGTVLVYLTHSLWMLSNPILGHALQFVTAPELSVYLLLVYALILASGVLLRPTREIESVSEFIASFVNGAGCYALFLVHTVAAFPAAVAPSHLIASIIFLGLAIVFWTKEKSKYSTFAYSILGYMALSVVIIKVFPVPGVFVWLSVQSLIVVATAVWFRSRFIAVANFFIYLLMVTGYLIVAKEETGISIGFGIVALASARILNWQQDRLELKTEMMRSAYLASAFLVFPYALYHLVPHEYVSLAWVGLAMFYYLMNLMIKAQKYRWMGHLTLLLTVMYVLIIGIFQLEATYRILSFLILGSVLLITSLVFTRLKARKGTRSKEKGERGKKQERGTS